MNLKYMMSFMKIVMMIKRAMGNKKKPQKKRFF